jgi:hypothetical protein
LETFKVRGSSPLHFVQSFGENKKLAMQMQIKYSYDIKAQNEAMTLTLHYNKLATHELIFCSKQTTKQSHVLLLETNGAKTPSTSPTQAQNFERVSRALSLYFILFAARKLLNRTLMAQTAPVVLWSHEGRRHRRFTVMFACVVCTLLSARFGLFSMRVKWSRCASRGGGPCMYN